MKPPRFIKLTEDKARHLEHLAIAGRSSIMNHPGRGPFTAACNAAIDDFSLMSDEHLESAIAFAEEVFFLTKRATKVLRLLKLERKERPDRETSQFALGHGALATRGNFSP